MSPNTDHFAPAKKSISWAREALAELLESFRQFGQEDNYCFVTDFDSDTGEYVRKIKFVNGLPVGSERKTTEAITTIKNSFDQSICAAVLVRTGTNPDKLYFPWATGPSDMEGRLKSKGVPTELWDIIAQAEPYARSDAHTGGNNLVRSLATIANNKHSVGITVIGKVGTSSFGAQIGDARQGGVSYSHPRWDAAKNEMEIFRYRGQVQANIDCEIGLHIVLNDPELAQPVNVRDAINAFLEKAQFVLHGLETRCLELQ